MFQTFDEEATRRWAASAWRCCANGWPRKSLDGFIVPRADEHQGEYVAGAFGAAEAG